MSKANDPISAPDSVAHKGPMRFRAIDAMLPAKLLQRHRALSSGPSTIGRLRATVLCSVALIMPFFCVSARAAITAQWETVLLGGGEAYYATPQQACQCQHDEFAPENPGPITASPSDGSWLTYECDWKTHADGDCPINPLPASVHLTCVDESGQPVSTVYYKRQPPGLCVYYTEEQSSRPVCMYGDGARVNPTVGDPIIVANGATYESFVDYQDADGRLTLSRVYRSRFGTGRGDYPLPHGLGDLWRMNFQWEMTLDGLFRHSGDFAVSAPDGSVYGFRLQTDGSVTEYNNGIHDLRVEFVNPSGPPVSLSSVEDNGGQFVLTTSNGDLVTMELHRRWGDKYVHGHPIEVVFRGGYTWDLQYGPADKLETITDNLGRTIQFEWNYSPAADENNTLVEFALGSRFLCSE